ncbi:glycosyltransferase [Candidatus Pelagibacter sp. HIMB1746]|uniref:glycosyltransferase n=1 Tax=Candidatus Pelagibacter sp. HIMB1746 TaxID=3413370 RepID=UPI003F865E42
MMKLDKFKTGIILPLKENYTVSNFGAVSIWVSDYVKFSKSHDDIIFCKKKNYKEKYLTKNINPIEIKEKFFTNFNYIKKINFFLNKKKIECVEIHNRPEYAKYLIKNNPNLKINLIFHNDPNNIRHSQTNFDKLYLLRNCNNISFVSNWVKKQFFKNLNFSHKNNTNVIYNFIDSLKKLPKKNKTIIFAGKLNKSKGYHIFCKVINKILTKYNDWSAIVVGNETREKYKINHERLKIFNWMEHQKLLKLYEKSSISVVNPTWEEPFGRTAMESASRGCAVITSISGGLSETFKNNLVLKKNDSRNLFQKISFLIENKNHLKKIQLYNLKNVQNTPEKSIKELNKLRIKISDVRKSKKRFFKILHVGNFGIKVNHRLFNISIASKITNGLIRNGHDVINFDYRNTNFKLFNQNNINLKIEDIVNHYRPDLVLFGHNNLLNRNSLLTIKEKFNCKTAIWYEDHVVKGDPNFKNNISLLERNNDLIDQYFITTSPDAIKTKIKKQKINFLPIPVDPNIESENFFEVKKTKDLFFALSNGVNYGKLKNNTFDERSKFINELLSTDSENFSFHFLGLFNEEPKWNYQFNKEICIARTALNLSRGGPSKYCSSNRIATLMGNGILPFIDEKVMYQDFFNNDEIETYKNPSDLLSKLSQIKKNEKMLIKRSKNAKKSYFNFFENTIVAESIIHKVFETPKKHQYVWIK